MNGRKRYLCLYMCTLSYVPLSYQSIITVNRDESPSRAASEPEIREEGGRRFWVAPEPVSGGSNLVFDIINHRLLVLLNGAYVAHESKPPYRMSRGVLIFEAFDFNTLNEMQQQFDFTGIEPFTLFSFHEGKWEEIRWDGKQIYYSRPAASVFQLWSSAKLYEENEQRLREEAFTNFIERSRAIYAQHLFDIHQRDRHDPRGLGFRLNYKDIVKTVSITQLIFENGRIMLRYMDLIQEPKIILERSF